MTRSEWSDDYQRIEARIEPFLKTAPTGEKYIDTDNTPGPLLKAYDALVCIGLEHGWLSIEKEA